MLIEVENCEIMARTSYENKGIKLSYDLANTKKATEKLGNMDKFKNTKRQLFSHNTKKICNGNA